jgi:DNA-binding GntR family transcriptional regulator
LREVVFDSLREAIISGLLRPNERLMEIQLAEELGVSRTPVREAIRKLELEGFVVMVPRKGAYVAGVSLKDITDVFEVRASLEALACGLAAERITDEELENLERLLAQFAESGEVPEFVESDTGFHDHLYRCSRNTRLVQMLNNLRDEIQRFRAVSLGNPGRTRVALEEHRRIVEAVAERNISKAQHYAWEHIEKAENTLLEAIRQNLPEGVESDDRQG